MNEKAFDIPSIFGYKAKFNIHSRGKLNIKMVELNELVGGGMLIFGALSLLYGIALCYTVKVS